MLLKPIEKPVDVYLLSNQVNMLTLRYLAKLQDEMNNLIYVSTNNVENIKEDFFDEQHLLRKEVKAGAHVAINAASKEITPTYIGIDKDPNVIISAISEYKNTLPIIVIDNEVNPALLKVIVNMKRDMIILYADKEKVLVYVKGDKGHVVDGYDALIQDKGLELEYADRIIVSAVIFMLINKLIAKEALIANYYEVNSKECSVTRKRISKDELIAE